MREAVRAYLIDRRIDPPPWASHQDVIHAWQIYGAR